MNWLAALVICVGIASLCVMNVVASRTQTPDPLERPPTPSPAWTSTKTTKTVTDDARPIRVDEDHKIVLHLLFNDQPVQVTCSRAPDDGAFYVALDAPPEVGNVRIELNDGTVFDDDLEYATGFWDMPDPRRDVLDVDDDD